MSEHLKSLDLSTVRVGFIGLGVMGRSMAGHLLPEVNKLCVYTRTAGKAEALLEAGAVWADSPRALAEQCAVVFTIVGFPEDVEAVYFREDGILEGAEAGAILVDMTTSTPGLALRIAAGAVKRGAHALDAPVSGGDVGAREARLTFMVGGEEAALETIRPLLQRMGRTIVHQGAAGSGQHAKMCNQIAIAGTMVGVCEALAYANKSGLNPESVLQTIRGGAAASWTLDNLAPRMLAGNFAPGFYVKHFIKDMRIARQSAREMGLATPGLDVVLQQYEKLAAAGGEDLGTQALYKLYDALADD
jgi:3-hydroxyisobutyrate dehydrogenase